eukprot:GHVR01000736.1.p1 GENE.GHVR01000736.1~~GHVR01000736.1.p1  ORF type:complete len:351 (+),score=130.98 GHVR01000736.1:145-1197(+)
MQQRPGVVPYLVHQQQQYPNFLHHQHMQNRQHVYYQQQHCMQHVSSARLEVPPKKNDQNALQVPSNDCRTSFPYATTTYRNDKTGYRSDQHVDAYHQQTIDTNELRTTNELSANKESRINSQDDTPGVIGAYINKFPLNSAHRIQPSSAKISAPLPTHPKTSKTIYSHTSYPSRTHPHPSHTGRNPPQAFTGLRNVSGSWVGGTGVSGSGATGAGLSVGVSKTSDTVSGAATHAHTNNNTGLMSVGVVKPDGCGVCKGSVCVCKDRVCVYDDCVSVCEDRVCVCENKDDMTKEKNSTVSGVIASDMCMSVGDLFVCTNHDRKNEVEKMKVLDKSDTHTHTHTHKKHTHTH